MLPKENVTFERLREQGIGTPNNYRASINVSLPVAPSGVSNNASVTATGYVYPHRAVGHNSRQSLSSGGIATVNVTAGFLGVANRAAKHPATLDQAVIAAMPGVYAKSNTCICSDLDDCAQVTIKGFAWVELAPGISISIGDTVSFDALGRGVGGGFPTGDNDTSEHNIVSLGHSTGTGTANDPHFCLVLIR